jgi:hypothetical protein
MHSNVQGHKFAIGLVSTHMCHSEILSHFTLYAYCLLNNKLVTFVAEYGSFDRLIYLFIYFTLSD